MCKERTLSGHATREDVSLSTTRLCKCVCGFRERLVLLGKLKKIVIKYILLTGKVFCYLTSQIINSIHSTPQSKDAYKELKSPPTHMLYLTLAEIENETLSFNKLPAYILEVFTYLILFAGQKATMRSLHCSLHVKPWPMLSSYWLAHLLVG